MTEPEKTYPPLIPGPYTINSFRQIQFGDTVIAASFDGIQSFLTSTKVDTETARRFMINAANDAFNRHMAAIQAEGGV